MEHSKVNIALNCITQFITNRQIISSSDIDYCTTILSEMNYRELIYLIILIDQKMGFDIKKFIDSDLDSLNVQHILNCIK